MDAPDGSPVEEFCRLCLKQKPHYFSLFDNQAAEMLESLTAIKISISDPAPNLACSRCFVELRNAYLTQQKLIKSELFLQEKISTEFLIKEECFEPESSVLQSLLTDTKINPEPEPSEDMTCGTCFRNFQNPVDFQLHLQIHETRKCLMCPKIVSAGEFQEHLQTHGSGYCEYCGKTLKNERSLRNHVRVSHSEPKVTCEQCGVVSDNRKAYDLHVRKMHTGDAPFICDYCGGRYFRLSELNKHIKVKHSTEQPFVCDVCLKPFALRTKLGTHKLKHSDKMLFICEFCGKGFKFQANMNVHKKSVHGWICEANFKCGVCEKGFPTHFALSVHSVMHRK